MNIDPPSNGSIPTGFPEDSPVPRPEDFIGAALGSDYRLEGIEAIGSKFVVFRAVNVKTGVVDRVAKISRAVFDPRTPLIEGLTAAMQDLSGDPDRIIRICDRLLALDAECEAAAFDKGVALWAKREVAQALEAFDLALSLNPFDVWNVIHRSACFATLGRDADCLHDIQEAAALDPDDLKHKLGSIPEVTGQIGQALQRLAESPSCSRGARSALQDFF